MSEAPYNLKDRLYPSWRYHVKHRRKLLKNAEDEAVLGPGWFESPDVHNELLSLAGESGESKVRRNRDISQAREAFHERLKDRVYSERPLDDLPACCVTVSSWEEELKEFVSDFIGIHLKAWKQTEDSKDRQKDRWFRESLVRRGVGRLVQDERKALEGDYRKYVRFTIDQNEVVQQLKPFKELDTSVPSWARSKAGLNATKSTRPERGPETRPKTTFPSPEGLRWEEVTLTFVSRSAIRVRAPGLTKDYSYRDMGFEDRRRKARGPNQLWRILAAFARQKAQHWDGLGHTFDEPAKRSTVDAAITRLRSALRRFFGIKDHPIRCKKGVYEPVFNIYFEKEFLARESQQLASTSKSDLKEVYDADREPRHVSPEKLEYLKREFHSEEEED